MTPALREFISSRKTDIHQIMNKHRTAPMPSASEERYTLVWGLRRGEFDPGRKLRFEERRGAKREMGGRAFQTEGPACTKALCGRKCKADRKWSLQTEWECGERSLERPAGSHQAGP